MYQTKAGMSTCGPAFYGRYEAHSPARYSLVACCFLVEIVMTMVFLFIIMGGTMARRPQALPRAK
jgi:glycerol uptake facilitator-like aquaporin